MGILGNIVDDFMRGVNEARGQQADYECDTQYENEGYVEEYDYDAMNQLLDDIDGMMKYWKDNSNDSSFDENAFKQEFQAICNELYSYGETSYQACVRYKQSSMLWYYWQKLDAELNVEIENYEDNGRIDELFLLEADCLNKAIEYAEESYSLYNQVEDYDSAADALLQKAVCLLDNYESDEARRILGLIMNCPNEDIRDLAKDYYKEATENLFKASYEDPDVSSFAYLPPVRRKLIFFVRDVSAIAGCYDWDNNIGQVFAVNQYPNGLTFPIGHPQANTLYVAHPVKPGLYLPYESAEDIVFQDKVEDFIRLLQCLGATEVTFKSLKGRSVSEVDSLCKSGSANYDGIARKINGEGDISSSNSYSRNSAMTFGHSRKFDPIKAPYCPEDIPWLDGDSSWQNLVKQRLDGNILEYMIKISSEDALCTSQSQKNSIKVSYEGLLSQVNANFDANRDSSFNSSESTEWEVSVVFKSLKDFDADQAESGTLENAKPENDAEDLTSEEIAYIDEVKFILEDGVIGDAERRLLERKRVRFGITEDRAAELEAMLAPSLTPDETEYLETFKEMCVDGEITPRMRKMLDREAVNLGLSLDRAMEIEGLLKH